jgi:methylmalonyl-CoA mutase C-terminal domain/subunit
VIPRADARKLKELGIGEIFGPGTPTSDAVDYIRRWVAAHKDTKA